MRQLTILILLTGFVFTSMAAGAEFDLAAYSAESPGYSWLSEVSDRIERRRTAHTNEACGSPLACARVIAATLWQCETAFPGTSFAVRATLSLYGKIYYYDGPYRSRKPARDASVVDADSAVTHEYTWHIIPAVAAVSPILDALEARRFPTREGCERAARETSEIITTRFQKRLAATQAMEQNPG